MELPAVAPGAGAAAAAKSGAGKKFIQLLTSAAIVTGAALISPLAIAFGIVAGPCIGYRCLKECKTGGGDVSASEVATCFAPCACLGTIAGPFIGAGYLYEQTGKLLKKVNK